MTRWMVAAVAVLAAGAAQAAEPVFLSPMGEPFRGSVEGVAPAERWFRQADADKDGRLTVEEMRKDAQRFFATLDRGKDGEIDPEDVAHYEGELAPEVAALLSMSGSRQIVAEGGEPDRTSRRRRARDAGLEELPRVYLDLTEPVVAADRNLNRGVSRAEFDLAAEQRFRVLDRQSKGYLTPEGLKPLLH